MLRFEVVDSICSFAVEVSVLYYEPQHPLLHSQIGVLCLCIKLMGFATWSQFLTVKKIGVVWEA